ncbi:hypothetical protein SLE2022_232360 [Rubroshorea leprosula]
MGTNPPPSSSSKEGFKKGAWTAHEDKILTDYIRIYGERKWSNISKRAGLKRSGKSCRLRWLNYLSPDIKRGNITPDEEDLILRLHKLLGNRWSLIAGRLPGRTDAKIKNYWNTVLSKKVEGKGQSRYLRNKKPYYSKPHRNSVNSESGNGSPAFLLSTNEGISPELTMDSNVEKKSFPEIPSADDGSITALQLSSDHAFLLPEEMMASQGSSDGIQAAMDSEFEFLADLLASVEEWMA